MKTTRRGAFVVGAGGLAVLVAAVGVSLFAAGSGGGKVADVTVKGSFGKQPDVTIPKSRPKGRLAVRTLHKGSGAKVGSSDLVIANYVGYKWNASERRLVASTYDNGRPAAFPSASVVPGLARALRGAKAGSRVVAVIPPADGYGAAGNQRLQISGRDSLVFVLDLLGTFPKTASAKGQQRLVSDANLPQPGETAAGPPTLKIPASRPPEKLRVETLIQGNGPPVRTGQLLAVQYIGVNWRTGKPFDSSWQKGQVFGTTIGVKQVLTGWDQGLMGKRVGSRLLLVVPPKWGYGTKGLKQSGIKGKDTLAFVVDILGAY